jgi:ABC-type transport system involved in cytochrome c biogenesis permease subunit
MRRFAKHPAALVVTAALASGLTARAAETVERPGTGPAYEKLGQVAVMHHGRVKPLDTVAREEVKQIYGRETITLHDPREEVAKILDADKASQSGGTKGKVDKWGPVGAFLEWTIRPEFWDDQPFILVDYLPLRRAVMAGTIKSRLEAIAAKETTPESEKQGLRAMAVDSEVTATALTAFVRGSKLPAHDRETIAELAAKLTEEHKWLSPRELREATIAGPEGRATAFMDWASAAQDKKAQFDRNPKSVERPTEIERRAIDVGHRLMSYESYSGERLSNAGIILIMPRPSDATYLAFTGRVYKTYMEAREKQQRAEDGLQPMEMDALEALGRYWQLIPIDDHRTPGEDHDADAKFADWLRDSSTWVPLKMLLKARPESLVAAGYPEAAVKAFLDAYRAVDQAEVREPGHLAEPVAATFLTSSRSLGEAVSSGYPNVAEIERETRFNAINPFWLAPFAYGAGLVLLVVSLAMLQTTAPGSRVRTIGKAIYWKGMAALLAGIAIEIYGFYLRIRISGWAPVTNMYETVIWVALVAAVLALIFELIFRQTYMAMAGTAVALLGTITAANVPLLDPSIRSLQPVLRSNLWLTIHVLTEVSSYAAFGLAWALGLIATLYYLTSTYRRSPRIPELMLPMVPGLLLLIAGGAGVLASYGAFGPQWTTGDALFYVFAVMGLLGETITMMAALAVGGELINRMAFRVEAQSDEFAELPAAAEGAGVGAGRAAAAASSFGGDGGVATLVKPSVAEIRAFEATHRVKLDARGLAMQRTAGQVKPLSNFIYRTMQVGVLLIAAGTILGGVWADYSWGRFWGWDAKEVWALITLLVYLIPLHGRFAGWVNTFWLVFASVFCFLSVVQAWYGVNFVLGVGLHSYGFVEGGSQGAMAIIIFGVLALPLGAAWRRFLGYRTVF